MNEDFRKLLRDDLADILKEDHKQNRLLGWIILAVIFVVGLFLGRATAATMTLSDPQHDYGKTPMTLFIDLDEGESYDLFRVHIQNGNIECRSIRPNNVQKLEWKMNRWPYRSYSWACGTWDTWSSVEMRLYAGFWQSNPINVTLSGAVMSFDWILKGDPCIGYAHLERDGVRTLLQADCPISKPRSSWTFVRELYR